MTFRVYIATTQGPVRIQRISKEADHIKSVICLDGTAKSLPISRAYHEFVREPTGVIERSYKHCAFRMDVDGPITDGNSWQLGAFIAHSLFAEDILENDETPFDTVIWLTGELDRDLNLRPVDHIQEKLDRSRELFEDMRSQNIPVFCFIPSGPDMVPDDDFLEGLNVDGDLLRLEAITHIQRIIKRFSLNDPLHEDEPDDDPIPYRSPEDGDEDQAIAEMRDNKWMKLTILAGCILALIGGLYMQFKDNLLVLRAGSLKLGLSEIRAHPDQGCQAPNILPIEQRDTDSFPASQLNGLCALEITLNNRGAPAYMWAFAQRLSDGHFLLADRESLTESKEQQGLIGWRMVIPANLSKDVDYRIVGLAASAPLSEPVNRMIRQYFNEDKPDWNTIKQSLQEEQITVISAIHSLVQ
jgi:hypothetical protein